MVRPFNAYGPRAYYQGERAEVIPRFIIRFLNELSPVIFGDGSSARDFTYVTEVAEGLRLIAACDGLVGREANIAYGKAFTIKEVAAVLGRLCDRTHLEPIYINSRPGDVYSLHADTSLANKMVSFKAKINFEDGLYRYLEWFKSAHSNLHELLENEHVNWKMAQ